MLSNGLMRYIKETEIELLKKKEQSDRFLANMSRSNE
jgi:hypothetical protein